MITWTYQGRAMSMSPSQLVSAVQRKVGVSADGQYGPQTASALVTTARSAGMPELAELIRSEDASGGHDAGPASQLAMILIASDTSRRPTDQLALYNAGAVDNIRGVLMWSSPRPGPRPIDRQAEERRVREDLARMQAAELARLRAQGATPEQIARFQADAQQAQQQAQAYMNQWQPQPYPTMDGGAKTPGSDGSGGSGAGGGKGAQPYTGGGGHSPPPTGGGGQPVNPLVRNPAGGPPAQGFVMPDWGWGLIVVGGAVAVGGGAYWYVSRQKRRERELETGYSRG